MDYSMDRDLVQQRFKQLKRERVFPSGRWLVAKMPKVTKYMIQKILSGEIYDAEDERIFRLILSQIGLTEDQFFERASAPVKAAPAVSLSLSNDESAASPRVPLFGEIPAGYATPQESSVEPEEWIEPPPPLKNKNLFALRVSGRSMAPRLIPGDIVYLEKKEGLGFGYKDFERPAPRWEFERNSGRIVAALIDGESSLKVLKVIPKPDSQDFDLFLVSINPIYPERYIKPDECFQVQGVVVGTYRDEKLPAVDFSN